MDGTLVDTSSIVHHVLTKPKNFHAFHYGSIFCPPHDWVVDAVYADFRAGHTVIVVTARKDRWWELSTNWLTSNRVPYQELHMRADDDDRWDRHVKEDILHELMNRYTIVMAYDDNPAIIALWQEYEIPVTHVPGWRDS